ncbi:PREDICTED: peroxisomal biogenesis factor 3 [Nicrophorus vespilloides]|uniref:Peroxisomal biogenesis factor 3 n=1 Tax=Nicrophorus vespilloides TaxID=110193 RepID=A0ABM1MTV1_NICVS|nr:PREDICTED: peroxisomal biogenesis factor 3 [Nicrophorus vespilloides]
MTIFSKVRGFLSRNRNKFLVGGAVIGGTVLLTKYAQQKLKDWQEKETREFLERTRKQQHFESTEITCNQTILSLIMTMNEALSECVNTEEIIASLRDNPDNKLELWEKLKVLVLTKASCLIYLSVMLVITLRIQLNVLGGYLFIDPMSIPSEVQQKYLHLCHNLLDTGLNNISSLIKTEYIKILGPMELKKQLKLKDFENIFWAIQTAIATHAKNPINHLNYLVVEDGLYDPHESVLNDMMKATADLLESDEVKALAAHCINRGFVQLCDQLADYYGKNDRIKEVPADTPLNGFVHPGDVQMPLAKLIPIINGLTSKGSMPDKLIQQLISNDKLKTFGENIYECFSHSK